MVGTKIFNDSIEHTAQDIVRKAPEVSGINILAFLATGNTLMPPWWSKKRDVELRKFWKKSDHLSGTIWAVQSKMTAIPFKILPRDLSVQEHFPIAEYYTNLITDGSQFGEGWIDLYSKWLEDFFTQDNGAFIEIIGRGKKDGELEGVPITMASLDSARCRRTGNPKFPVVYESHGGKLYKFHHTRIAFASQMPSSAERMFGVGFCAVGRCINAAQNLIDIATFKQEKLGSRPNRQIIITQGGLDPADLKAAISEANMEMSNQGLTRYAKTIAAGSVNVPDAGIQVYDLANYDGFNEEDSVVLGMATVALAFGYDAQELFPVSKNAGKADAIIQHIKQRGKSPALVIGVMERLINRRFLPSYLKMVFDLQDDAEDRQAADVHSIRSTTRTRDIEILITDTRTERETMLNNGEITEAQFIQLELGDGRLKDGVSVESLFFSQDAEYKDFLGNIDKESIESLEGGREKMLEILSNSKSKRRKKKATNAIGAMEFLLNRLITIEIQEEQERQRVQPTAGGDDTSFDFEQNDNKRPTAVLANSQISDYYNNQTPENKDKVIKKTLKDMELILNERYDAEQANLEEINRLRIEEAALDREKREKEYSEERAKRDKKLFKEREKQEGALLKNRLEKESESSAARIEREDSASRDR